jgi:hypothetical protein
MDTQTENADETLPSAQECGAAVGKLMLSLFFIVRNRSGILDAEGTLVRTKAKKTGNAVRKVIDAIDGLWAHGEDLRRDYVLIPRFLPLVIELERKANEGTPVSKDDPDLRYIDDHWLKMTGRRLTAGQLQGLVGDLDDETRLSHLGPAERGRFRVARLFGLASARQIHKIEKAASATAPHLWGHEPPFSEPFPEVAQLFATLYFFEDVLDWPFPEVVPRMTEVVTKAGSILQRNQKTEAEQPPATT